MTNRTIFKELEGNVGPRLNLDTISDIPITLSIEVGSTKTPIRNLLDLNQGSIIELDKLAGEPLDIKINGSLFARGEVVTVNEKYGIRLTEILSSVDKLKKMRI